MDLRSDIVTQNSFLDKVWDLKYFSTMSSSRPFVSFVIPVYNEEYNIPNVLRDLNEVLEDHPEWNAEVLVVEDGSRDNSKKVLLEAVKRYPETQLILHAVNQGYNRSLRDGIERSKGEYVMYIGADEEFDISEVPSFIAPLKAEGKSHADVVLGVRWQRNAYKLHRFFLSVIYIFFLNALYKLRINDYNWSQVWSRELLDQIDIESKSLFILPEIIIKAFDLGYKISEVPSNHRGRHWGKSSLNLKIMFSALWDGLRFHFKRLSPDYKPGPKSAAKKELVSVS
ncbi:MAG: glycosyltransferase family 2 protein [Candidatus Omnitrophica bacterium]|nr:glycosyltransferase family 2 protein [Candidatus Omnitrophota bacterium]